MGRQRDKAKQSSQQDPQADSKLELEEPAHSSWGSDILAPSGLKGLSA